MAKNLEGEMQEALDRAADEAVNEFEAQSEAEDEIADDAEVDEGDEDALEAADEQSDDDSDSVADDEEPADGDEQAGAGEFEWDGNPETVPDDLKPYFGKVYDTMRKGVDVWMSKKAQEWNVQRQQYEARLHELEAGALESKRAALEPKMPTPPGADATQDQIDEYYDKRARYASYQQLKELQEAGFVPGPQKQAPAQVEATAAVENRLALVQKQDGFTDDIAESMLAIAQSNPALSQLLLSDEGAVALFQMAKTQSDAAAYKEAAAKAKSVELQRKASAGKRKVSKPQSATKKVSPSHTFSGTLEDVVGQAFEEALSELG